MSASDVERAGLTLATGGWTTLDGADLKALLLSTGGKMFRWGALLEIASKHLGAGVYRVELKEPTP